MSPISERRFSCLNMLGPCIRSSCCVPKFRVSFLVFPTEGGEGAKMYRHLCSPFYLTLSWHLLPVRGHWARTLCPPHHPQFESLLGHYLSSPSSHIYTITYVYYVIVYLSHTCAMWSYIHWIWLSQGPVIGWRNGLG